MLRQCLLISASVLALAATPAAAVTFMYTGGSQQFTAGYAATYYLKA